MTISNNQKSADSLAAAMDTVMNSDEHKSIFKKAQSGVYPTTVPVGDKKTKSVGDFDKEMAKATGAGSPDAAAGPRVNYDFTGTEMEMPLYGKTSKPIGGGTDDPGNAGLGALPSTKGPAQAPSGGTANIETALREAVKKGPQSFGVGGNFQGAFELANSILSGKANMATLDPKDPTVKQLYSGLTFAPGQKPSPEDVVSALKSLNSKKPPQATASDAINVLVKVADYLGENGYRMSEAIADNLIKSIIIEAKKKDKKEKIKKMKECLEDEDSKECKKEKKK